MSSENKAGRYQLLDELGRGAMGVVWKGFDPTIGRTVAVKVMTLTEAGTGMTRAELAQRFQNETRAAGLLAHPNIVTVYDAGEDADSGQFFITMEYVQGSSLQALLDRKQVFPIPRIMKAMEQICSALGYAHDHKVIHRDIKPANIMLAQDDTVKVTDFGTAKIIQLGTTQTGAIVGTPSYMSPEQVKGRPVDGRSDIFSLGVVLYELVTGEKPFPGQNVTTVIYKIVHEEPISAIELDSSVHPGLNEVIRKALAKNAEDRYQTCRELFEDLRNYRDLAGGRELGGTVVVTGRPRAVSDYLQSQQKPAEKPGTLTGVPVPPLPTAQPPRAPIPPPVARPHIEREPAPPPPPPPPAHSPRATTTLPPLPYTPPEKPPEKSYASVWISILALAVLGLGGYILWPTVQESLGTRPAVTTQLPAQPPAETPTEAAKPPEKPPVDSAAAKPAEPKPAETKTAPPPAKSDAAPADDALAQQKRIEQRLARAGFAGKVRVDISGKTVTLTGNLKAAEHRRLLQAARPLPSGWQLEDRIQVASAGGSTDEEKPKTAAGLGEVEVVTDVMGATVTLTGPDGQSTKQKTPWRFEELPPGRYTIEVTHPGYRPLRRIVQVQAGRVRDEQLTLQPYSSGLYVVSKPDKADVYVNGRKHAEQTPTTIVLPAGRYSIKVQKAGFQDYATTMDLTGDSLQQLSVPLSEERKGVGLLEVRTVPPGADIIVNGTNSGRKTPFTLELPAGEYTLTLFIRGYQAVNKRVVVQADRTSAINEVLPK
jgi:serine/threonine protein kinase